MLPAVLLSPQPAPKPLPVFLLLHGVDPSSKAALPLTVEVEILIKTLGRHPSEQSFTWKGEWKGFGKDLLEPLGDLVRTRHLGPGETHLFEGIVKSLSITNSKGKAVIRLKGTEGPKVEPGPKVPGLNMRIECAWKADGMLKLGMSLDPIE